MKILLNLVNAFLFGNQFLTRINIEKLHNAEAAELKVIFHLMDSDFSQYVYFEIIVVKLILL